MDKKNVKFAKKPSFRHWVQAAWFAVTNGYAYGYVNGKIYTGRSKQFCVPGLNCYSCPGALGACPIGSLQATLDSADYKMAFYMLGILMLFGSVFGRFVCGWLCPFGLVQDLLYKIPLFKKRKNLPGHKRLVWLKYIILLVFVIALPSLVKDAAGGGSPWFCEFICPSGTLLGGIPLTLANADLRAAAGWRFAWKLALLVLIIVASMKIFRPFCKYLCPLGAVYSVFNPIALYRFSVDKTKCVECGACQRACRMDIKVWETPNSLECIRCGDCRRACPKDAICRVDIVALAKAERAAGK